MDRRQADAGHHRLKLWLTGAAILAAIPSAAFAEDRPAEEKGVLSLAVENDSLSSGADRNYTSGIRLSYVSPSDGVPDWLQGTGGFTRAISNSDPDFWGLAIGQSIFTPEDISANPAPPDQHPYAGYVSLTLSIGAEEDRTDGRAPRFMDNYEFELGLVGPSALGEEAQSGIHQILGAPEPLGWDSQLHDEVVFAASFDRRWRALRVFGDFLGGIEADITPSVGASLGTLRTEARAGVALRVGQRIDSDYGPPRVRPSIAGAEYFAGGPFSWNVFAAVQGRAVAQNIFLDGNTYEDSPSVDRNPYVADFQTGFSVSAGDWRLAYTYVWRTEEFDTQPTRQDFGSLALSWRL